MLLLALASVFYFAYAFLAQQPNMFRAMGVPVDTRNFLIQQVWREHMLQSEQFAKQYPEDLRDRLRVIQNRKLYRAFGHDAFVGCDFCVEIMDYYYFILPAMVGAYVGMGALLGLATVFPRMDGYRMWGCALLALVFAIEANMLNDALERNDTTKITPDRHQNLVGSTGGASVRYLCFSFTSFALLILLYRSKNGTDKREVEDVLKDIAAAQEAILQRQRVFQLARAASTTDSILRQKFIDSWKRRDVEHSILLADPEYQSARDMALARIDVAAVTKETEEYIEGVLAANHMDHLLGLSADDSIAAASSSNNTTPLGTTNNKQV
ncbi:hypothetical protein DFQ27_006592 [Actinomortierella ambigua]|uniref:Uncharacterized protein n=1 Tax=Actinomortierella ambigua TaxID=1343610 RepID=A0A9P6PXN6_9FUNG|nr:hypothetical protein DFQ27_006592 [Actinomortierella ambigua]